MIQTPDIVLFSLTDNNSNDVFERALRAHLPTAVVLLIRTCDELWETIVFDPAHLPMIIVMDEGILGADVDPSYLQIFPYYLRWGGNLVFAHHFITASKRDIEFLFNDVFDLGWTKGDFFSGKFITNKHALENIPCSETFPEFYSNLGDYKQQTLNTFTRGILIKGARPDERIYIPCPTLDLLYYRDEVRKIRQTKHQHPKDEPQNWTFDPYTYDIDPTGISTRPLDDNQTILARAAFDQGYVFLSGDCHHDSEFWQIIDAILAPKESNLGRSETESDEETDPDGNWETDSDCSWDSSPNIHKKRETVPKERPIRSSAPRPSSPWSDPENPWLYGPKPPCHVCESLNSKGIERNCDRGSPCSECLMHCPGGEEPWCEYPGRRDRQYKGEWYSTWDIWKPEEIEKRNEWYRRKAQEDEQDPQEIDFLECLPSNCVVS